MAFLAHIISIEGVEVDIKKGKVVIDCPILLNPIDIRSFFRLAGSYRRFVDGFLFIASPLTTLTSKSVKF